MAEEYAINVKNLNKSFNGKPAVVNVSLRVAQGEIFGFLGPNGSGKTTTIRMLCGLIVPDQGEGQCLGYDIRRETAEIKQWVGYVPQAFSLYQDLTVKENLEFIARAYLQRNYKKKVEHMMSELELHPYKNILSGKLSGGWKQRLSLAAALIHDPKLLLLDEPTAGVDPKARREFWNYISYLTTKGISALVSTHYMDEAERCHRLAYIIQGHLVIEGTIQDIIQKAGIVTWSASGKDLTKLVEKIEKQSNKVLTVVWGNELRISASSDTLLQPIIEKFSQFHWQRVDTSLEEIFIHLVEKQK